MAADVFNLMQIVQLRNHAVKAQLFVDDLRKRDFEVRPIGELSWTSRITPPCREGERERERESTGGYTRSVRVTASTLSPS